MSLIFYSLHKRPPLWINGSSFIPPQSVSQGVSSQWGVCLNRSVPSELLLIAGLDVSGGVQQINGSISNIWFPLWPKGLI